jgi:hypothetical protein
MISSLGLRGTGKANKACSWDIHKLATIAVAMFEAFVCSLVFGHSVGTKFERSLMHRLQVWYGHWELIGFAGGGSKRIRSKWTN